MAAELRPVKTEAIVYVSNVFTTLNTTTWIVFWVTRAHEVSSLIRRINHRVTITIVAALTC